MKTVKQTMPKKSKARRDYDPIAEGAEFATAATIIKSPIWPITRDVFYSHLKKQLTPHELPGSKRKFYRVAEVRSLFVPVGE